MPWWHMIQKSLSYEGACDWFLNAKNAFSAWVVSIIIRKIWFWNRKRKGWIEKDKCCSYESQMGLPCLQNSSAGMLTTPYLNKANQTFYQKQNNKHILHDHIIYIFIAWAVMIISDNFVQLFTFSNIIVLPKLRVVTIFLIKITATVFYINT